MVKFDATQHGDLWKTLPFSYCSSRPYVEFFGYTFARNDEQLVVWDDPEYPHEFPSIFTPRDKRNWEHACVYYATPEEIEKIKAEKIEILRQQEMDVEFYYDTQEFVSPKGDLAKRAKAFLKKHPNVVVKTSYPVEAIKAFYGEWKGQRAHTPGMGDDHDFFLFCLDNFDRYGIKQVYLEDNGKLVGFAFGVAWDEQHWIGLHLKVMYEYRDASRFLNVERAKQFADLPHLTLGGGCGDAGIIAFKKGLKPTFTKTYFRIKTGKRYDA